MTFPEDRDVRLEELLRESLHGEADAMSPAGDGLATIQRRVAAQRARRAWLRPLAVAASVAVVAAAGITAYTLSRPGDHDSSVSTQPTPSGQTALTTSPTPSPTATTQAAPFPAGGMFPYTTADDAHGAHGGSATWDNDPVQVAQHFVTDFAGVSGVTTVISQDVRTDTATVTLGRDLNGKPFAVTTVRMVRYDGAWVVIGADDGHGLLRVSSPAPGDAVSSPVVVTGPDFGVDEAVQLSVRSVHSSTPLGHGMVSFGSDGGSWRTSMKLDTASDVTGGVVAFESSMQDGGPARLTVVPVSFTDTTLGGYPHYFYGVKSGRVTEFAARNGASIKYLTSGTHASDPQRVQNTVYFIDGSAACGNALRSVPTAGGAVADVATPPAGYGITAYAISADGVQAALFETSCAGGGSRAQGLFTAMSLVSHSSRSASHTVAFQAFPPMVVGDPTWEPDNTHVDAVVRTGNSASVVRYDLMNATSWHDTTETCSAAQTGLPTATQADGTGAVWFGVQSGGGMSVYRCAAGKAKQMFSVPATDTPADIAVTSAGSSVLLSDGAGTVWRWSTGDAAPTRITPTAPQQQVSW